MAEAAKTVLITGASRNIGARLAERFAASGQRVMLMARSSEMLEAQASRIRGDGGSVHWAAGDVSSREDVAAAVRSANERFGPVGILVNNAVVRCHRAFLETSQEEWDTVLGVTLGGMFNVSQAVLPGMVEAGWGRVINMAGISGQTGAANRAAVVTAKSGVLGLTKALAMEFAESGVTVNAVSPGRIATERGQWTSIGDQELTRDHYSAGGTAPIGRQGTVDEVCAACEFLASSEAGFITAQVLNVNGGLLR